MIEELLKNKSAKALRTISEAASELEVDTHVLRFWESKFKQIKPQKRNGRRYYRPEDIQIIKQIKTLLHDKGYTIKGALSFLNDTQKQEPKIASPEEGELFIELMKIYNGLKGTRKMLTGVVQ